MSVFDWSALSISQYTPEFWVWEQFGEFRVRYIWLSDWTAEIRPIYLRNSNIPQLKRMNSSFTTFQHYIGYSSNYSHTCIVDREIRKERQKLAWNFTTVTLVLLRSRSKVPIHGIDILPPHPMDDNEYDGYIQWTDEWYVGASSGNWNRSSAWKARRVTARPPRLPHSLEAFTHNLSA